HARFTNLYGPTEATIASSYYTVPRCPAHERAPVPIGTACDGEELLILDDEMRPVRDGEIGNLYIGGVGLSPGYWNDPEKTRSVFLPRPGGAGLDERLYRTGDLGRRGADGLLYFAGRTDTQIKSRGYRIELGEIESALNALPGLRQSLASAVPAYMLPARWMQCDALPRNANGKADRPELQRRFLTAEAQSSASTPRLASGPVLT